MPCEALLKTMAVAIFVISWESLRGEVGLSDYFPTT
jgi:hypothetical protein